MPVKLRKTGALCLRSTTTVVLLAICSACEFSTPEQFEHQDATGEPERGKLLLFAYGCAACHEIRGMSSYPGGIGPPLTDWSNRKYIAGRLPNQPELLIRWIIAPEQVEPGTAMPNLAVTEAEARDMAAYLYAQ